MEGFHLFSESMVELLPRTYQGERYQPVSVDNSMILAALGCKLPVSVLEYPIKKAHIPISDMRLFLQKSQVMKLIPFVYLVIIRTLERFLFSLILKFQFWMETFRSKLTLASLQSA